MSQILTDGNQLLYECILCHKYRPREQIVARNGIEYCKNCDDPIATKEDTIEPMIIVIPKLLLPSVETFNLFMDDILFYKCDTISTLNDRTLTLTTTKTKKFIQINIDALLQILCDKYEHPTIKESTTEAIPIDLQIKMQNLYADIQDKLDHAILKYNKILCFEDKRIKDLCENYAMIREIPLRLKLEYQEWEKALVSGHISREIAKGLHEKEKEVSKIQQDYAKNLEDEKVKNNTNLENYSRKILKLQGVVESLNSMRSSSKEEFNTIKLEKDEMYDKYKALELQLQEKDTEVVKLKFDSEKLKKELNKHKIVEEWMLDPTSTDDEPIYFNQVTGDHVTYPRDFKEKYKPDSVDLDNDILIYKEKNGNKEFKLPKSLLRFVKSTSMTENGIPITNDNLADNDMKVLNALSRDKEDGKTIKGLSEITGIATSHIGSKHLKKLMKLNMVAKFEDDDKKERFYRI